MGKRENKGIAVSALAAILCAPLVAVPRHLHPERHYQERWCSSRNGITEYRLQDGARVDCLTDEYAVEFDFAPKWAESVGQALYYAHQTSRRPGIVLIMENKGKDKRYLERLRIAVDGLGVRIWIVP